MTNLPDGGAFKPVTSPHRAGPLFHRVQQRLESTSIRVRIA